MKKGGKEGRREREETHLCFRSSESMAVHATLTDESIGLGEEEGLEDGVGESDVTKVTRASVGGESTRRAAGEEGGKEKREGQLGEFLRTKAQQSTRISSPHTSTPSSYISSFHSSSLWRASKPSKRSTSGSTSSELLFVRSLPPPRADFD